MENKKRTMTTEHKAAIAAGRSEGAAVRRYLETLQSAGKPGRRVSKAELEARLAKTTAEIESEENALTQLDLAQKQLDLKARIAAMGTEESPQDAEADFVRVAKSYAERKGITYKAFREIGVPPEVLKRAGIARTRTTS